MPEASGSAHTKKITNIKLLSRKKKNKKSNDNNQQARSNKQMHLPGQTSNRSIGKDINICHTLWVGQTLKLKLSDLFAIQLTHCMWALR
eukprot:3608831-Amphidinium_carterae.1